MPYLIHLPGEEAVQMKRVLLSAALAGEKLLVHDPGLPPIEARKVSLDEFDKCFNFEGANGGITVFHKI